MVQMCAVAAARGSKPTLLILEEINRCNLASVIGDLIIAIDPAHRGEAIHLQVEAPSTGGTGVGSLLAVPQGLKLLATMNNADKSIALVDYAIRRRFRFLDVLPDRDVIQEYYDLRGANRSGIKAVALFDKIFALVQDERLRLGQSYFLCEPGMNWAKLFANRIVYEVFPMLREYISEGRHLQSSLLDFDAYGQIDFDQETVDPTDT